jgi:hypothetical protein
VTESGAERVVRFAFELARRRKAAAPTGEGHVCREVQHAAGDGRPLSRRRARVAAA